MLAAIAFFCAISKPSDAPDVLSRESINQYSCNIANYSKRILWEIGGNAKYHRVMSCKESNADIFKTELDVNFNDPNNGYTFIYVSGYSPKLKLYPDYWYYFRWHQLEEYRSFGIYEDSNEYSDASRYEKANQITYWKSDSVVNTNQNITYMDANTSNADRSEEKGEIEIIGNNFASESTESDVCKVYTFQEPSYYCCGLVRDFPDNDEMKLPFDDMIVCANYLPCTEPNLEVCGPIPTADNGGISTGTIIGASVGGVAGLAFFSFFLSKVCGTASAGATSVSAAL